MKVSKDQHLKAEGNCLSAAAAEWSVTRDQTPGTIWGYHTSTFFLKIFANMYRERKTWSSRKFGESKFFFGEDGLFQMKEFRTTLIYIYIYYIYTRNLFVHFFLSFNPPNQGHFQLKTKGSFWVPGINGIGESGVRVAPARMQSLQSWQPSHTEHMTVGGRKHHNLNIIYTTWTFQRVPYMVPLQGVNSPSLMV